MTKELTVAERAGRECDQAIIDSLNDIKKEPRLKKPYEVMKIKGCPLCGSNNCCLEYTYADMGYDGDSHVLCGDCGLAGPKFYMSEQVDAIKAWNKRV